MKKQTLVFSKGTWLPLLILFLGTLCAAPGEAAAPVVTNVVAQQISGTGFVRITYDVSDADGDSVTANIVCSSNGGTTFDLIPVSVSGDVHHTMQAGAGKQILWNAALDYPGRYWSQVVAMVFVSDGPAIGGEMVFVPAGNFTMGSTSGSFDEQPQHTVYLNAFYIDKYEVTNADFEAFINAGGYTVVGFWSPEGWSAKVSGGWTQPVYWGQSAYRSGSGYPGFPVIGVSWYEAEAYANFVGKRLPTEAEWEKAARGTDARTYPWGEGIDGTRANYSASGDPYESGSAKITPVGFYDGRLNPSPPFQTTNSPGPYGAYDQAGNVWEWVRDWYSSTYYSVSPSSNPLGPTTGSYRVFRGGGWLNNTPDLRCARRNNYYPSARNQHVGGGYYDTFGFRCARTQ
ncbi:MAG: formylglycine-generating enzyme family protein [Candidatus Eisenbacteria bacterium]|nr:formylglycine-generating enzyme family protein [Candidatus Eisenbacteria bacterium]